MWAAGIAAGAALVGLWSVGGAGFLRLSGVVLVLVGAAAAAAGTGLVGWLAVAAAIGATVVAGKRPYSVALFAAVTVLLAAVAIADSPVVLALSGSLFLGGVTAEMMLGHWYLVDPRLPRWALQGLVIGAGGAMVVDVVFVIGAGALDWGPGDEVIGWAFLGLSALSAGLLVAVSFALREPSYTGVMAATGLSYLAVLTSFGVVVLGRLLAF